MRQKSAIKTKLLFLISHDFGELSNGVYFVQGYNFSNIFLLPPRLFKINHNTLPGLTYRYQSLENIIDIIEQEKPEVIFLFSGYLYGINQIFSLETLKQLIAYLQTKSLKFVTSDPFLGALSNITSLTFSDRNPYQKLFINHFAQVCSILADIAHLYPVPFDSSQQHQSFSFFNPNLIITSQQIANYQPQLIKSINLNPQKKRWLFILSSEDYLAQINLGGQTQFQQILQDKLWETTQAGRQPILIAPRKCIQMLNHCSTNFEDAILLSFCAHHYFMQLLLEAEYLFLWNIFSNCLIPRLSNRRPVFFFDKGHMALAIPAILNLGMQYNYNNAPLTYLEQTNTLNSEQLAQLIPQQEATFTPTRKAFFSCATPETVVQQIIAQ